MKRLISFLCVAALTVSSFAGFTVTAFADSEKKVTVAVNLGDTVVKVMSDEQSEQLTGVLIHSKYNNGTLETVRVSNEFTTPQNSIDIGFAYAENDRLFMWNSLSDMIPYKVTVVPNKVQINTAAKVEISGGTTVPATLTAAVSAINNSGFEDTTAFTYEWKKGNEILSETGATLTNAVEGNYTVTATYIGTGNYEGGVTTSSPYVVSPAGDAREDIAGKVTVSIISDKQTAGATLTASISADETDLSEDKFTYVWSKNGSPISGGENGTLENAQAGEYTVVATVKSDNVSYKGSTAASQAVTIKAVYTITWKNEDGSTIKTTQVASGETPVFDGTAPTKVATAQYTYTFAGWTPTVVAATADAEYTATFSSEAKQFDVTYTTTHGTAPTNVKYTYGVGIADLPTLTDDNYNLVGWYSDEARTQAVTSIGTAEYGNKTLYAKWQAKTPDISIDFENTKLTGFGSGEYKIDGTAVSPDAQGKLSADDYIGKTISIVKKATLPDIDSEAQSLSVDVRPAAPTGIAAVKRSVSQADGQITGVTTDMEYKLSTDSAWTKVLATPITGLEHGTYYVRKAATDKAFASENVTVTVETQGLATVIFKNDNGTVLKSISVAVGDTPSYGGENPTKDATAEYTYTFSGWTPELTPVEDGHDSYTYTATYNQTKTKYTVIWKNEDGTVLETDENVEYGAAPSYDGATPTKTATAQYTYTHSGWTPAVSSVAGDVTYTATYTETTNTFTVKFNDGTSDVKTINNVEYGTKLSADSKPDNNPEKRGYTFAGWVKDDSETVISEWTEEEITADTTYNAKWTETTYTIALPSSVENGTINGKLSTEDEQFNATKADIAFADGLKVIFTVNPSDGYMPAAVTINDNDYTVDDEAYKLILGADGTATVTLDVTDDITVSAVSFTAVPISSITIAPDSATDVVVNKDGTEHTVTMTETFTVTSGTVEDLSNAQRTLIWSIEEAAEATAAGVSINSATGEITVAAEPKITTPVKLTVKAQSPYVEAAVAEKTIRIDPDLVSVDGSTTTIYVSSDIQSELGGGLARYGSHTFVTGDSYGDAKNHPEAVEILLKGDEDTGESGWGARGKLTFLIPSDIGTIYSAALHIPAGYGYTSSGTEAPITANGIESSTNLATSTSYSNSAWQVTNNPPRILDVNMTSKGADIKAAAGTNYDISLNNSTTGQGSILSREFMGTWGTQGAINRGSWLVLEKGYIASVTYNTEVAGETVAGVEVTVTGPEGSGFEKTIATDETGAASVVVPAAYPGVYTFTSATGTFAGTETEVTVNGVDNTTETQTLEANAAAAASLKIQYQMGETTTTAVEYTLSESDQYSGKEITISDSYYKPQKLASGNMYKVYDFNSMTTETTGASVDGKTITLGAGENIVTIVGNARNEDYYFYEDFSEDTALGFSAGKTGSVGWQTDGSLGLTLQGAAGTKLSEHPYGRSDTDIFHVDSKSLSEYGIDAQKLHIVFDYKAAIGNGVSGLSILGATEETKNEPKSSMPIVSIRAESNIDGLVVKSNGNDSKGLGCVVGGYAGWPGGNAGQAVMNDKWYHFDITVDFTKDSDNVTVKITQEGMDEVNIEGTTTAKLITFITADGLWSSQATSQYIDNIGIAKVN